MGWTSNSVVEIPEGGTGKTTAQEAIDALTDVASATAGYVLTKDTTSGSAEWKVTAAAGSSKWTTSGSGWTYLTTTTEDLAVGGSTATSPLYFDVSSGELTLHRAASAIRSGQDASDVLKLEVYDVDGAAYADVLTMTAGNTPTANLDSIVTHDSKNIVNDENTITFSTGVKTFENQLLKLRNPLDTASFTIVHGAITADRDATIPALDGNDTFVFENEPQTLTLKTIDGDNNTISNLAHGAEVDEPSSGVHGVTGTIVGTTDTQTLSAKTLTTPKITDGGADHTYNIAVNDLLADRTITLPLLTGDDDFVFEDHTQTLTNKTLTSPVLNTQVTGTAVLDDDTFATANATTLATSESIKAYVDSQAAGANTALSNLASVAINTSLISDTDITDDLGTGELRWNDVYAATLSAGTTAADTLKIRGRDIDGASWVDVLTITSANTVTANLDASVTIGGNAILDSTWTGSTNVVTLGTVTTGTWSADLAADTVDAITEIAASLRTGSDLELVTGTAGTAGNLLEWDANGDAVEASIAQNTILGRTSAGTGDVEELTISSITEEASPATGDYLLGMESGGSLRKFDYANLMDAPAEAEYLVTSAHDDLSAEVVVSSLTANLTFKGDDSAGRTITLGQQVTFADSVTVDVPIANFMAGGATVVNTSASQTLSSKTLSAPTVTGNITASATDGQVWIGETSGGTMSLATLTATTNETDISNGANSITLGLADNVVLPGTESATLPSGTTAQRPTAAVGQIRYNSTTKRAEYVENNGDAFANISNVYDIRSYGAAIDGSTNDTTAWNDAITAANAAGGGTVVHPGGNSRVTGTITLLEGVFIRGLGDKTTNDTAQITHAPAASAVLFDGTGTPSGTYNEFPGMCNLQLTGDATNTTYLVDLSKPQNTVFQDMRLEDCATAVVRIRSGIYTLFRNCRLDAVVDGAAYGIHYDTQVGGLQGTTLHLEHCQIREGAWGIYVEADALADLHCTECNFESTAYGCAYLSEGGSSNRAHYFFQDIRGEGINKHASTESAAFSVGMGAGSNAVYFYANRMWITGHSVRNTRTLIAMERGMCSIGDVFVNRFYDGIISTSSQTQAVHFHGPVHLRSDDHVLFSSINDWGDIHGPLGWNIGDAGHSTIQRVVQEAVTLSGATSDTTFNLPADSVPRRVHVKLTTAATGSGLTGIDVSFTGGLSYSLISAMAIADSTAEGHLILGDPIIDSATNVRLEPVGAATFTGGVAVVTVYYDDLPDSAAPVAALQLPHGAAPEMLHTGDVALDEDISLWTNGMIRYYDDTSTEMVVLAMTATKFESPTGTYIPAYNATNDELEWVENTGPASEWTETTGVLHPNTATDDLAIGGTDSTSEFFFDVSGADLTIQGQTRPTVKLINPTGDNTEYADLTVQSDSAASNRSASFRSYAASFSSVGATKSNSLLVLSNSSNSNGISIAARATAGDIRFYTAGIADTDLCVEIDSDGRLEISQSDQSASAWGTTGIAFNALAATYTDSSTAASGTAATAHFTTFQQPTLAATNLTVTTTDAATVYIAAAPAEGTNQTITNAWALWVDDGLVKIDYGLMLGRTGDPASPPDGTIWVDTTTTNALQVQLSSSSRIIPYLTGGTNNELVTAGGANFLVSEGGLTWDGSDLSVTGTISDFTNATGIDANIVTGTAGTAEQVGFWNSDGDMVSDAGHTYGGYSSDTNLWVDSTGGITALITANGTTSSVKIGANSNHVVNIISNNVTGARVDNDSTAGNTRLLIYDVDNATLERVTVGAADSGGSGYKVLRIPN